MQGMLKRHLTLASFYKNNLPNQLAVKSPQIRSDLPPITLLHLSEENVLYLRRVHHLCAGQPCQHAPCSLLLSILQFPQILM